MKKKLVGLMLVIMISIELLSCNKQSKEINYTIDCTKVNEIGNDIATGELFIASENINLQFYKFTHIPYFTLDCLAASEMNNINVLIDIDTPYKVSVIEDEMELDLHSFALFSGYDWKKAEQLRMEDEKKFKEYQNEFITAFRNLDETEIGELHHYVVTITFDFSQVAIKEDFSDITVTYDGKTQTKNIGHVAIDCTSDGIKKAGKLYATSVAYSDVLINKNSEGAIVFSGDDMFETEGKVCLDKISLLNNNTRITDCKISICSDKENINMTWNNEKLDITSNAKVGLTISFQREDFKNISVGKYNEWIVLEYSEGKQKYQTETEAYFTTGLSGYQLYAYYFAGIDVFETFEL